MTDRRTISWIKQARKEFLKFPGDVQIQIRTALSVALKGRKADIAKPLAIFGSGVFEIALQYRSDAYRAVYALKIDEDMGDPCVSEEIEKRYPNPKIGL